MRTKQPDILRHKPDYLTALTLAEIHLQPWELRSHCRTCGLRLRVSGASLITLHGPDAVW